MIEINPDEIEKYYQILKQAAENTKHYLNPDLEFVKGIVHGLLTNKKRFGYPSCPCRLATGDKSKDFDIICPCIYRDPDLNQYDSCYCALYVSQKIVNGEKKAGPIPERRPPPKKIV